MKRKKAQPESLPPEHCLLSEFDTPVFRWLGIARSRNAGWYMALACFLWAALTILFGHLVGANACGLELQATVTAPNGDPVIGSQRLVWGWLAQVNAGPFYLVVAPVLLVITHRFLIACGQALSQLSASGRLKPVEKDGIFWYEEMAQRNRVCVLALWTLPLMLIICFNTQLSSIERVLQGYPTAQAKENKGKDKWSEIGYSQSIAFENWVRDFNALRSANTNSPKGTALKLAILKGQGWLPELDQKMFAELDRRNVLKSSPLTKNFVFKAGRPVALQLETAGTNRGLTIEAFSLRSTNDTLLHWKKFAQQTLDAPRNFVAWYYAFVMFEQMLIAAFFTFGIWLTFKIVFWLWQIHRMLPRSQQTEQTASSEQRSLCSIICKLTRNIWWILGISWLAVILYLMPLSLGTPTIVWSVLPLVTLVVWLMWKLVAWSISLNQLGMEKFKFGIWLLITFGICLLQAVILKFAPDGKIPVGLVIVWTAQSLIWGMIAWHILGENKSTRCELELNPILNDPTGRYGLGALFRPYNLLALTAALGASYIAFTLPFGVHLKDITGPDGAGSGETAVGHLLVITIVFSAIVCGPLWFFPKRLGEWAKTHRLEALYEDLITAEQLEDAPAKGDRKKALLEEESQILKQTTWPSGDNRFKVTLAIILAILLLPLGSALNFLPGEAITATQLPQVIREKCREVVADWYQLQPTTNNPVATNLTEKSAAQSANKNSGDKK